MMIPVAIISLVFSVALYGILSLFFDRFLPNVFGIENVIVNSVKVPGYVYLIGIFTTLIFCILSAAIPYFTFKKRNESEKVAADFHSEEQ
jgi:H+/gluconate symporter-like permease